MTLTPTLSATEVLELARLLADKIRARRPAVETSVRYYRGAEGRMRFASEEFKDYFEKRFVGFSDNWCAPVAQAPIERLGYLGMRLEGDRRADVELERAWERNDAFGKLNEALLLMTIAKRAFGLVSPHAGGRLTFENPDSAAVTYDALTGARRAGLTITQDDTHEYAQLLLPQMSFSLQRPKVARADGDRYVPPDADGWQFTPDREQGVANPLGAVPLVEMSNQALLDNDPISDIGGVMPMQDSINLVWAYTLNSLDYISLPGRVIMNGEMPKEDIKDEDGNKIGERPLELDAIIRDRIAWLEGQGIQIDEWKPGSVDGFVKVIELAVAHTAAQTRTPAHYLLSSSDNVPATGYDLAEAGLVSKANERIGYAQPAVRELNRLLAVAGGDTQRAEKIATGKVLWRKPQFRSEAQLVDGLQKLRQIGFPMEWIAEEYGLDPEEVRRVMDMIAREQDDPYLARLGDKDRAGAPANPAPLG
jgi:hypothetical protein